MQQVLENSPIKIMSKLQLSPVSHVFPMIFSWFSHDFPTVLSPGGDLRQRHGAALSQRRQDVAWGTAGAAEGWLWQRLAGRSSAPEVWEVWTAERLRKTELEDVVIPGWKCVKHVAELRFEPDFERATATCFFHLRGLFFYVRQRREAPQYFQSSEGPDVSFIYTSRWSIPSDWPHGEPPIPTDETLIPAGANWICQWGPNPQWNSHLKTG